ncbi:MAG TPA: hypothetical protein VHO90_00170, partial [Bacteroidales bacterium]|nr:hypothetical protein [Bacteroidales bacterium]
MEGSKYFVIGLLLAFSSFYSTRASYKTEIYRAFISNNMNDWKKTIDMMHFVQVKSDEFIFELLNYQYGYIGWCLGTKNKVEAEKYTEMAWENLKVLEKRSFHPSSLNAYK